MKTLFFILMLAIPLPGLADIYKCKDARQVVVYQDTPCTTRMIGTVKPVPTPSDKDVAEARRNLDRLLQENRYYEQLRQQEMARNQEHQRFLEAQELRERELMAAEAYQDERYYPLFAPGIGNDFGNESFSNRHRHHGFDNESFNHRHHRHGFGHEPFTHRHRHHNRHFDSMKPVQRRPCVIGFVGDRSCR
jgi:hypothetical protein